MLKTKTEAFEARGDVIHITCACANDSYGAFPKPFSSPEVALLLFSTKNRDLWPGPTREVCDSRTSCHSAYAQSQV